MSEQSARDLISELGTRIEQGARLAVRQGVAPDDYILGMTLVELRALVARLTRLEKAVVRAGQLIECLAQQTPQHSREFASLAQRELLDRDEA